MIPNTMFSPMVVTMMKKDTSNKIRSPEVLNSAGTSGNTWQYVIGESAVAATVTQRAVYQSKVVNEPIANDSNETLSKSVTEQVIVSIAVCLIVCTFMQKCK